MNLDIARKKMVESQIIGRGIEDSRVIEAMLRVPRHLFVQEAMSAQAYSDSALPIGEKQTISQPYMVAYMAEKLELRSSDRVLEIGTGSGYHAAILAGLAQRVYTIERIPVLAVKARKLFDTLGLTNIAMKIDDGTVGWSQEAPFDAILVTAGAPRIPDGLLKQLAVGGRLVIPVGDEKEQVLIRVRKDEDGGFSEESLLDCRFVKLIGKEGWKGYE
ncbi:MAG: protein-L-isoaspartate(D-aspartate) O-methyltransferase [Desulfuromonadales bacterium]|nr:protein-L-isoaspartate(D-aspartate) O-methyltransferase [Desulfuromonadales bacterium]